MLAEDGADLVIAMTRAHVREIVALDPSAWERTFTLKELARLVRRERLAEVGEPGSWVARFGAGRTVYDLLGDDERDDVADPYGGSLADTVMSPTEIDEQLEEVVDGFLRHTASP